MTDIMNCYAHKGDQVTYTKKSSENGYPHDQEQCRKLLAIDGIYTVDHTEVHFCHTDVYLEAFPNERFNSVMFEDYTDNEFLSDQIDELGQFILDEFKGYPNKSEGATSCALTLLEDLKRLVQHCYLYSGYRDCGYVKMDRGQRRLYNSINDRPDTCESCGQAIYYSEDEKTK